MQLRQPIHLQPEWLPTPRGGRRLSPGTKTSVLSGKFVSLIRDGFSSSVRRATQQCREYFEVAQQSCRRKDARSSGVNFPDSALDTIRTAFPGEKPPEVRRCDESGCTPVEVIPRRSGVFLNLTTPGGGYLLKFLTNDVNGTSAPMRAGDFVEVATLFLGVWVSYGHCPSQDPPQSREGE